MDAIDDGMGCDGMVEVEMSWSMDESTSFHSTLVLVLILMIIDSDESLCCADQQFQSTHAVCLCVLYNAMQWWYGLLCYRHGYRHGVHKFCTSMHYHYPLVRLGLRYQTYPTDAVTMTVTVLRSELNAK